MCSASLHMTHTYEHRLTKRARTPPRSARRDSSFWVVARHPEGKRRSLHHAKHDGHSCLTVYAFVLIIKGKYLDACVHTNMHEVSIFSSWRYKSCRTTPILSPHITLNINIHKSFQSKHNFQIELCFVTFPYLKTFHSMS